MIPGLVLAALLASANRGHGMDAGALPVCDNQLVVDVAKRAGCTVGDTRCWTRSGGFCNDWIEKKLRAGRSARKLRLVPIPPRKVARGDVAMFSSRAHYAYVERVVRNERRAPVAVDVSEYNFGTCWVDRDAMVTDMYRIVNRRSAVPLRDVDGGFLRARER